MTTENGKENIMDEAQKAAADAEALKAEEAKAAEEAEAEKKNPKTFTQEDFDKQLSKTLSDKEAKLERKHTDKLKAEREDWERQAKLSSEEKESEATKRRDAESADRERGITLRENRADAREVLQSKNISADLVDFVVDVDGDKTNENIDNLEKAFNKAVEIGVTAKTAGTTPTDKSKQNNEAPQYGDSQVL